MSSDIPAPCPYCKRTPDVSELPERRGHYRVACLNEECQGKLISEGYSGRRKAIRAWGQSLLERARIKERLRDFTLTHFALWRGLVVWNDVRRYPDLPLDSKEKPLYPPNQRNITNEFQIRYLSSAHEAYLVLALWNLLYDESKDTKGHLRKLAERLLDCGVKSKCFRMEHLNDCLSFLENKQSAKAFERYRHKRLAHLGTYEETKDVRLNSDLIYRLVPKTSYLFELLHEELEQIPSYTDNQWSTTGLMVAHFFSHSGKDELLFKLFRSRVVPSEEYRKAVRSFISKRDRRERKAHAFPKARKKVTTPTK